MSSDIGGTVFFTGHGAWPTINGETYLIELWDASAEVDSRTGIIDGDIAYNFPALDATPIALGP